MDMHRGKIARKIQHLFILIWAIDLEYEKYLDCLSNENSRILMSKFRLSAHCLEIEVGRYNSIPEKSGSVNFVIKMYANLNITFYFVVHYITKCV